MKQTRSSNYGFTLVELLVVIGIIAVLASILLPAINKAMLKAEEAKARTEVQAIATAWKTYFNEYGRWMLVVNNRLLSPEYAQRAGEAGMGNSSVSGLLMNVSVMTNIMYPNASWHMVNNHPVCINYNPKRITFMEYRADSVYANGDMVDPWDHTYKFMLDVDGDGKVSMGGTMITTVYANVIVWSTGRDGTESADDLRSWE